MNTSNLPQQTLPPSRSPIVNYECDNVENEERNGIEIAEAALGQPHRAGEVPFYTGNRSETFTKTEVTPANFQLRRTDRTNICPELLLPGSGSSKARPHSVKHSSVPIRRRSRVSSCQRSIYAT